VAVHTHRWAVLVATGAAAVCALTGQAFAANPYPVQPEKLIVQPSWISGLANAHPEVNAARSIATWTQKFAQQEPDYRRAERRRLKKEGFREGVRDLFADGSGLVFSEALVLGSQAAANREPVARPAEKQKAIG
jgi:hypothetical protein